MPQFFNPLNVLALLPVALTLSLACNSCNSSNLSNDVDDRQLICGSKFKGRFSQVRTSSGVLLSGEEFTVRSRPGIVKSNGFKT